jgi:Uma2 family endonuclease
MEAHAPRLPGSRLSRKQFNAWLERLPASDGNHYELIHGRIVMTPPADFFHASIGSVINHRLRAHVERHALGRVLDASAGYDLPSGDTLEPDVSFVSKERLAAGPRPERGRHARIVPDLVVEILSRSTHRRDRTVKKTVYAANGVREYWLVDPDARQVTVLRRRDERFDQGVLCVAGAHVTSEVLPGLDLAVDDLFVD